MTFKTSVITGVLVILSLLTACVPFDFSYKINAPITGYYYTQIHLPAEDRLVTTDGITRWQTEFSKIYVGKMPKHYEDTLLAGVNEEDGTGNLYFSGPDETLEYIKEHSTLEVLRTPQEPEVSEWDESVCNDDPDSAGYSGILNISSITTTAELSREIENVILLSYSTDDSTIYLKETDGRRLYYITKSVRSGNNLYFTLKKDTEEYSSIIVGGDEYAYYMNKIYIADKDTWDDISIPRDDLHKEE